MSYTFDIDHLWSWPMIYTIVCLLLSFTVVLYIRFRQAIFSVNNLPGLRTLISEELIINVLLPTIRGISLSDNFAWEHKYRDYKAAGWDVISMVAVWPPGNVALSLADPVAIKEVVSSRHRFPKPTKLYSVLNVFGPNVVSAEFDEWKRLRKIVSPAFSVRNNLLVYEESSKVMLDLFQNQWNNQNSVIVEDLVKLTFRIALSVLSGAAFGRPMRLSGLSDSDSVTEYFSENSPVEDAMQVAVSNIWIKMVVPEWAMCLTKRSRAVQAAFRKIEVYARERIDGHLSGSANADQCDYISLLLASRSPATKLTDSSDEDSGLTDDELIGNLFVTLLAGQETVGHTFFFMFALLALYQDEQEALYRQIQSILPNGQLLKYTDLPKLTRATAVAYETLRMFPPNVFIPKVSTEDTVITAHNHHGQTRQVPVPTGTKVMLHISGVHYNPHYWPEPEEFKPDRFMGDYPKDAFMPFNLGARACLGRKFFEIENVVVLVNIIQRYRIILKEEPQFKGESFAQRKERVLACSKLLTLTPGNVSVVFERRT